MREEVRAYFRAAVSRSRRFERREFHEFRRWLESTRNLVHLSVVLFVPLLVGLVTLVANATNLPFLLFPPLASGAYLLFAHPEERYSSPLRFVAGLTAGALCGWLAIELTSWLFYAGGPQSVHAPSVAFAMFLTGAATWAFGIEEPAAFSTALLAVVSDAPGFSYVLSIAVSSLLVAGMFVLWHRQVYRHRARYLYQSTKGDDHVLVPMRGEHADATAMLGARIAAAHDAGKVVLLDIVESTNEVATDGGRDMEVSTATKTHASHLEACAERIETSINVPCEVAVIERGTESPAKTALGAARESNCDLIVTPYEKSDGSTTAFVASLFRTDMDVIAHRSADGRTDWSRVLVSVRRASDVAHSMLDFACRLTGTSGNVSVCRCIDSASERRDAESMLAGLVETASERIETRVAHESIEEFLADASTRQDLLMLGASAERSAVSRLLSPATFQRLHDIECDVAIVDRRYRPLEQE
ncbi:HPP family protein [Halococcus sp. AFM35]|uniref:HPP family protein n=1 Tax=Halococcus sp. AFM35 TaxID=3421653 RepID=UPI003EB8310B